MDKNTCASGRFTEDRDVVRIPVKSRDIVPHPPEGRDLILQSVVAGRVLRRLVREGRVGQEAERSQALIQVDKNNAFLCKVCSVIERV